MSEGPGGIPLGPQRYKRIGTSTRKRRGENTPERNLKIGLLIYAIGIVILMVWAWMDQSREGHILSDIFSEPLYWVFLFIGVFAVVAINQLTYDRTKNQPVKYYSAVIFVLGCFALLMDYVVADRIGEDLNLNLVGFGMGAIAVSLVFYSIGIGIESDDRTIKDLRTKLNDIDERIVENENKQEEFIRGIVEADRKTIGEIFTRLDNVYQRLITPEQYGRLVNLLEQIEEEDDDSDGGGESDNC